MVWRSASRFEAPPDDEGPPQTDAKPVTQPAGKTALTSAVPSGRRDLPADPLTENPERHRFPVQPYAYRYLPDRPGVLPNIAETLFWHPLLPTDANGRATINFDLPGPPGTFRVLVDACAAGRRGSCQATVTSKGRREK